MLKKADIGVGLYLLAAVVFLHCSNSIRIAGCDACI